MKITPFLTAALATAAISCATAQTNDYTVRIPLSEDEDGLMAYMIDYDTSEKVDSTVVESGVALFKGTIAEPIMVQLYVDGSRAGSIILEPGTTEVDVRKRKASGTPLNDRMLRLEEEQEAVIKELRSMPQDSTFEARYKDAVAKIEASMDKAAKENAGNPIGYYLFLQQAYNYELPQLDSALVANPKLATSKRIAKLRTSLEAKASTVPGQMFKDFTIANGDSVQKLSDYVGKGRYTLVDFWASWCGPCMREIEVIRELYNMYNTKGLDVLGVAVWDKPEDTARAIEQKSIPWQQIINAQQIPTDIYGISGIPCIILFDPEGRIVSRDLQDDELRHSVHQAMYRYMHPQSEAAAE